MDTSNLKIELEKTIESFKEELAGIRVGRANPQLVEKLEVDYYGAKSSLQQIAQISVPDAKTIMISPWNKDDLVNIEKAVNESDLNLTPNNDGEAVILKMPPITEERRLELVKLINKKAEEARVSIRQKREAVVDDLNKQKKEGSISEDDYFSSKEEVQKVVGEYIKKIDEQKDKKEGELGTL